MEQWIEQAKPAIILGTICAIVTTGLGITNHFTAPVIAQQVAEATSLALEELMSDTQFIPVPCSAPSVVEAFHSEDYQEFIVTTVKKGYGGLIFATVAFDHNGTITGVIFQGDDESVGIGKQILDQSFYSQYLGQETQFTDFQLEIDNISGATISSLAATEAVEAAIEGFLCISDVSDDHSDELDEVLSHEDLCRRDFAFLLPEASTFQEITVDSLYVDEAYAAMDGSGYVLYLTFEAHKGPMTIATSLNPQGVIINIKVTEQNETNGIGSLVAERDFLEQFQGYTGADGTVDVLSSASRSSAALIRGANAAIDAFAQIPEIDYQKETDLIHVTAEDRAASAIDNFYEVLTYTDEEKYTLRQEALRQMFPLAASYVDIEIEHPQVLEVLGTLPNMGYVFAVTEYGFEEKEMTIIIGLNTRGEVIGVRQFALEPTGVDNSFMGHTRFFTQFLDTTESLDEEDVSLVSGATYSSKALYRALDLVFTLYEEIKEGE